MVAGHELTHGFDSNGGIITRVNKCMHSPKQHDAR